MSELTDLEKRIEKLEHWMKIHNWILFINISIWLLFLIIGMLYVRSLFYE